LEVLSQLGGTIPDSFDKRDARTMVKKTSKILGNLSEENMMLRKASLLKPRKASASMSVKTVRVNGET
jgi:hypothetical protein